MRLRKISTSLEELKREDPNTSLTQYAIRQLVIKGEISHIRRGNKILLDYDELLEYLSNSARSNNLYKKTGNQYIMAKVKF